MNPIAVSLVVFALVFGGALIGMLIRTALPPHHVSGDSKDVVRLGMGVIAALASLVLGLVTASTNGSYSARSNEITQMAAKVILLDRVLAQFGPGTEHARGLLRQSVASFVDQIWNGKNTDAATGAPIGRTRAGDDLYDAIQSLSPGSDAQRSLQGRALDLATDLGQTRLLLLVQATGSVPAPFLWVLAFWFAVIFASFGVFAPPPNATFVAAMAVCALSVAAAIFLILELDRPFEGLIQISDAPLTESQASLGR